MTDTYTDTDINTQKIEDIDNIFNIVLFFFILFQFGIQFNNLKYLIMCSVKIFDILNDKMDIILLGLFGPNYSIEEFETQTEQTEQIEQSEEKKEVKKEVKYEEKYLDYVRKMPKSYFGLEREKELKYDSICGNLIEKSHELNEEIVENEFKILELKQQIGCDNDLYLQEEMKIYGSLDAFRARPGGGQISDFTTEEKINILEDKNEQLNKEYINHILQIEKYTKQLEDEYTKSLKQRLANLKNNFVIDMSPLGNVLMTYNSERETFDYYSDHSIPYRYLETVGRRFVKTFDCRPIYYDMEEELANYEKQQKEKEEKIEKEKKEKEEEKFKKISSDKDNDNKKKNVFAKFKNYNKEAGTGHVNMGVPPKTNNISITANNNSNSKILLKENANKYSYQGKISNFSILQKIPTTKINKKQALSFAEYKKILETQQKNT